MCELPLFPPPSSGPCRSVTCPSAHGAPSSVAPGSWFERLRDQPCADRRRRRAMGSPATCFSFEGDGLWAGGQQPLPWEPDFVALRVLDDEAEPDSKFAPAELFVLPAAVTTRDTETVCSPAVGAPSPDARAHPPQTLVDRGAQAGRPAACQWRHRGAEGSGRDPVVL